MASVTGGWHGRTVATLACCDGRSYEAGALRAGMALSARVAFDDVASLGEVRGPAGMLVERKGLSLTLHYRTHPEIEAEVHDWATTQATRSGLRCRPARMSYELHPPIDVDKGTAVRNIANGVHTLMYVGDDVGDLSAFAELDRLAEEGRETLRVAVRSDESARELLDQADLVVDGPAGVRDLLRALAGI